MERCGDVEYLALCLLELFECGTANVESAFGIDINNGPKTVGGKLVSGRQEVSGSPIDHCVDLAVVLYGFGDGVLNRGVVANVGRYSQTFAAILLYELLHGNEVLLAAAGDREPCP